MILTMKDIDAEKSEILGLVISNKVAKLYREYENTFVQIKIAIQYFRRNNVTIIPKSLHPFHIVCCYIKRVETSWTYSTWRLG